MELFSSVFRHLFERFAHLLHRREAPQRAQRCAEQQLAAVEKLPEERQAFDFTANDRKSRKRRRKVPKKYQLGEREEEREVKINKGGSHEDEAEIDRVTLSLEKIKKRGHVHQKKREMRSLEKLMEGGSELREAGKKKRKETKRKEQKIPVPKPLLVEVKPLHTVLKPIEGEPKLPSVSGHFALPAAHLKPLLPPVHPQKPAPAPVDVLSLPCSPLQVDPPKLLAVPPCPDEVVFLPHSSSKMAVPPRPTPAPDELFSTRRSSSQVRHLKRLPPSPTHAPDEVVALRRPPSRKPPPFTSSLFEPPPQLMLIDLEDEENEYVEYPGKTIQACVLLKSERPQMLDPEIKPRKTFAWLEKDSEVQEEASASGFKEDLRKIQGDSKAIQGLSDDASRIDEHMRKLFCVASPDGAKNETQHNVRKKCQRKVPLVLLAWAEKAIKRRRRK